MNINLSWLDIASQRRAEAEAKRRREELNKWYEQLKRRRKDKPEISTLPIRLQTQI